jgi:4-amino-4-deoxychorismate lyase
MMSKIPIFTSDQAIANLQRTVHGKAANFYAMYSSVLGGIVTDPTLMVLPLDDHMVHRGHAVFDTATLTHGMLYQLDPHLDRLIKSAAGARIPLPFSRERLRQIILETAAAGRQSEGPCATGYPPVPAATALVRRNVSAAAST